MRRNIRRCLDLTWSRPSRPPQYPAARNGVKGGTKVQGKGLSVMNRVYLSGHEQIEQKEEYCEGIDLRQGVGRVFM